MKTFAPMLAQPLDYKRHVRPVPSGYLPDPLDGQPTFEEPQWQWDAEVKLDGVRVILYLEKNCRHTRALTRIKGKHTGQYADKATHLAWVRSDDLVEDTTIIDGEVTWGANSRETMSILGCHTAESLRRQVDRGPLKFTAFDLIMAGGKDVRFKTYEQRRAILQLVMFGFMEDYKDEVDIVYPGPARQLWAQGWAKEGIMLKAPMHQYQDGIRSPDWMKAKRFRKFIAVVTGFQWGKKGKTGQMEGLMGSLSVSMLNKDGILIHVGDVGTGFAMVERSPGAWPMKTVVEVESSDVTEDNILWHPRFVARRPDLRVEDAMLTQLEV